MINTRNRTTEARRRATSQILGRVKFLPGGHVGPVESPKMAQLVMMIFDFLLSASDSKGHLNTRAVNLLASQRVRFSVAVRGPGFRRLQKSFTNSQRIEVFRAAPLELRCFISTKELHCLESLAEDIFEQLWTATLIAAPSKPLQIRTTGGSEYLRYRGQKDSTKENEGLEPWLSDSVEFGILHAGFLLHLPMIIQAVMA